MEFALDLLCCSSGRVKVKAQNQVAMFPTLSIPSSTGSSSLSTSSFLAALVERTDATSSSAMPNQTADSASKSESSIEQPTLNVACLEELVRQLARPVQKYPSKAKDGFRNALCLPRERYFAVIPAEETEGTSLTTLGQWRKGRLAYWENGKAFQSDALPKGSIRLLKILKVQQDDSQHGGRAVIIRHADGGERKEMLICFHSTVEAREFAYKLWELISKLRGKWNSENPDSVRLERSSTMCSNYSWTQAAAAA